MNFLLAWRNIWRNKRRTLITAGSVFFAVLLAILMRSLQHGVYDSMIRNAAGSYLGYVQVHHKGYWNDKSLDNTFIPNDSIYTLLRQDKRISIAVPRLESFALASFGNKTKSAMVIGTDLKKEAQFTRLNNKIVKGKYLTNKENAALVAEELAKQLNIKVKDTLVLLGRGYHGYMAAGKYVVSGIVHLGSPELNRTMVYLPLKTAQTLYSSPNRLTSITLDLYHPKEATAVSKELRGDINHKKWEVMNWKEMMPQLVQIIQGDSAGGVIVIGILYLIIAFGVFGTILMMIAERKHELTVLTAIGMRPFNSAKMFFTELLFMIFMGVVVGVIVAIPIVAYFNVHPIHFTGQAAEAYKQFGLEPIYPFAFSAGIFINQGIIILLMCMVLSLYPWFEIMKLKGKKNKS